MTEKMAFEKKHVITHEFRVGFPHVFTAHKMDDKSEAKYSLEMSFPKTTNLSVAPGEAGESIKSAAFNAAVERWGEDKTKWPKTLRWPWKDGDKLVAEGKDHGGYVGSVICRASSKKQPGLVDRQRKPILSEDDFYPGCYARAELAAFAYDTAGNKGVAFTLLNLQKIRDGEKFSGRKNAADVFSALGDLPDESEKAENYDTDFDFS